MTEQQYKEYERISEEIEPIKKFLFWCGERYKCNSVGKYDCRLITKVKKILIGRKGYGAIGSTEVELSEELQDRIIEVVEDYVAEKERMVWNETGRTMSLYNTLWMVQQTK